MTWKGFPHQLPSGFPHEKRKSALGLHQLLGKKLKSVNVNI